ncbi:MAG: hypothetical protein CMF60_07770 [Magnetococcales bacterium]|nr:hypothetical protein [Magnetococcales bacterium]|tara:strand:+ start:4891 stop:5076 length:186 start_codon:yes stop_codon:yes gene_type:complete
MANTVIIGVFLCAALKACLRGISYLPEGGVMSKALPKNTAPFLLMVINFWQVFISCHCLFK